MRKPRSNEDLARVAFMYYVDNLSQQQIAKRINTSRGNVSLILSAAKKAGIVDVRINYPENRDFRLEQGIINKYKLHDVYVVKIETTISDQPINQVGRVASRWLIRYLDQFEKDSILAGVSMGSNLQAMVNKISPERRYPNLTIVQTCGGLSCVPGSISGQELTRELGVKLKASTRYLNAPTVFKSFKTLSSMRNEPTIIEHFNLFKKLEIALVGIGIAGKGPSARILEEIKFPNKMIEDYRNSQAVGDTCFHNYNIDGEIVKTSIDDHVLTIDIIDLKNIPIVVGIVTGIEKLDAVRGAIHGGLINVLICDNNLATSLLNAE